jgi:hypothetical protein
MYLSIWTCIWYLQPKNGAELIYVLSFFSGEAWPKRRRDNEPESQVLLASRSYERSGDEKTAGCLADNLHCNIWARAQEPAKLSFYLVQGKRGKGWAARGAVQMDVLKWKPGRATPKPQIRIDHPIMDELGPKIVHFLVDLYVDWFASLQLPPTTGKHDQLNQAQINLVLDRLETIQRVVGEVQLFTAVKISHSEFKGSQIVHCTPFKKGKQAPRMVCIDMYSYVLACIIYAVACIMYVLLRMGMY